MKRIFLLIFLVFAALNCFGEVESENPLKITMEAYRIWNASDATSTFEILDTVFPGDEVLFVIFCEKEFTDSTKELSVSALIPEGTTYVSKSATGEHKESPDFKGVPEAKEVRLFFSVDEGKDFCEPPVIFDVEMGGMTISRVAKPEMYTNIKWVLSSVPEPGEKIVLQYIVKVSE